MEFNFQEILDDIGNTTVFELGNEARPAEDYILNAILPEENHNSYDIDSGNATIRPAMVGLVGMDSPYPEGSAIETSEFKEKVAKLANAQTLPEKFLRELQALVYKLEFQGGDSTEAARDTIFNFMNKVIVQPHLDRMEWMRGLTLTTGRIQWTFGKLTLDVDYEIPTGNFLTHRTGNDGYGGSTSKFWDDMRDMRRQQNGKLRTRIMSSDTKEMILANEANQMELVDENTDTGAFSVTKYKIVGGVPVKETDPRFSAKFVTYDGEGEVYIPGQAGMRKVKFFPDGIICGIGEYNPNRFVVGTGATPPPTPVQLGYTHIGPTVEGGGRPGRWVRAYTPQDRPWQLVGEGVTNGLPVLEAPERITNASTVMV